jgi:hypothetical protein
MESAKADGTCAGQGARATKQEPTKIADATKPASAKSDMAKLQPKPEPSFFDDLFGGTPAWVIGGGALAALGGIAALVAARRRKTVKFEDSIIGGTDIKTNTVFGSTGGGVVNTGEKFARDRFQPRGPGQHRHRRSRTRSPKPRSISPTAATRKPRKSSRTRSRRIRSVRRSI